MTNLKCGEWQCSRTATQVPTGFVVLELVRNTLTDEEREEDRCMQAARALRCNVHVGAEKRRTYGGNKDWTPIAERADLRLLAEGHYRRVAEADQKVWAERQAEQRRKAEARFAEEWKDWGKDEYTIQNDSSEYPRENAGVKNLRVSGDGSLFSGWDVATEQGTRFDDLPLPVYVRINRTGSMSPNEARALAKALNIMADRVDAANALIMQNNEVENAAR